MPQYLISIHHPDEYDAFAEDDQAMRLAIDDLNRAMVTAGVRTFVGGLQRSDRAKSFRVAEGEVSVTDGPYLETREHVGGLWVLEVGSLDEALDWGRKAAVACRAGVEVRAFH